MKKNDFIEFYGEHNISPVKQNISDMTLHFNKRKKLYRQLGMPIQLFKNAKMIEIGSGGGYNTIAFFEWGANVDIVEPNKKGIEDMTSLFQNMKITSDRYKIFHGMLEEFDAKQKYDIVIAEGFMHGIDNKKQVISKLCDLVNNSGIVVVSCMDEISFFVEQMKRLVAHISIRNIKDYNEKVEKLSKIFEPQLNSLPGVSRNIEDWVQDQLLNPANNNKEMLSLIDAMHYFSDDFNVLGCSPNMFTDYSWYKDIWYDYKKSYEEQFKIKHHNLLLTGLEETILSLDDNKVLEEKINKIKKESVIYETNYNFEHVRNVINELNNIKDIMKKCDEKLYQFTNEAIDILTKCEDDKIDLSSYPMFFTAFGRCQQYISLEKK